MGVGRGNSLGGREEMGGGREGLQGREGWTETERQSEFLAGTELAVVEVEVGRGAGAKDSYMKEGRILFPVSPAEQFSEGPLESLLQTLERPIC